jgi:hypothetical protein
VNADQAILTSALVTAGSTIGSAVLPVDKGGHDIGITPRLLLGTGLTFTALATLGSFAPGVAVPLSVTLAVTALMWYGIPVLEAIMKEK